MKVSDSETLQNTQANQALFRDRLFRNYDLDEEHKFFCLDSTEERGIVEFQAREGAVTFDEKACNRLNRGLSFSTQIEQRSRVLTRETFHRSERQISVSYPQFPTEYRSLNSRKQSLGNNLAFSEFSSLRSRIKIDKLKPLPSSIVRGIRTKNSQDGGIRSSKTLIAHDDGI